MNKLKAIQLRQLKPKESNFRLSDGNGLFLLVSTTGTKSWQYRYQSPITRKEQIYTIGKYPELSLEQARTEHQILRAKVKTGNDIQKDKINLRIIEKKKKKSKKETFEDSAIDWNEYRKKRVGKTTWDKDWSRVERFIFPRFADRELHQIQAKELLEQLTIVAKNNGRETAMRTMNHVASILKYAMALGKIQNNVAQGLTEYLPKPEVINHSAILDEKLLGQYIYTVENSDSSKDLIGCAIRLIPHIFARHSEILSMKWSDIDLDKKTWTYEVGKTRNTGVREQTVFLSEQVIKILEDCKKLSWNSDKVFMGGDRNGQISQRATMFRIRELGFDKDTVHVHGFRATARTLGYEKLGFGRDVVEKCLAHKTSEQLGESYDRTTLIPERKEFYNKWSDYLIECKTKYQRTKIKRVK